LFEGRSTKANQPPPSVFTERTIAPLATENRSTWVCASTVPSLDRAMPRRCPVVGCAFHGIGGTFVVLAKTGGVTGSYADTCVSARSSSARLAAPVRVPASVMASGVRYEYPTQPAPKLPAVEGASAVRTCRTVAAMSFRYGADPTTDWRAYCWSFAKSLHS